MAAAPAFATAATWTVKPGGATTAKAGKTTVTDVTAGQSVTCSSSTAKGSFIAAVLRAAWNQLPGTSRRR